MTSTRITSTRIDTKCYTPDIIVNGFIEGTPFTVRLSVIGLPHQKMQLQSAGGRVTARRYGEPLRQFLRGRRATARVLRAVTGAGYRVCPDTFTIPTDLYRIQDSYKFGWA